MRLANLQSIKSGTRCGKGQSPPAHWEVRIYARYAANLTLLRAVCRNTARTAERPRPVRVLRGKRMPTWQRNAKIRKPPRKCARQSKRRSHRVCAPPAGNRLSPNSGRCTVVKRAEKKENGNTIRRMILSVCGKKGMINAWRNKKAKKKLEEKSCPLR